MSFLSLSLSLSLSLQSTPLHLAAGYNRTRVVELLLKHGADVHAKDKGYGGSETTPMDCICQVL